MNAAAHKECFIKYATHFIKRKGIENLLGWLEQTDFYTAPASTKFHSAFEGGLVAHSVLTYVALDILNKSFSLKYPDETIAICGLMHDLCKVNFYEQYTKNAKIYKSGGTKTDAGGSYEWEPVSAYKVRDDDQYPVGHGEKSVLLLSKFMQLSVEETLAIRWHMGGFDDAVRGGSFDMSKAFHMSSLCVITHMADLAAANIYENKKETVNTSQPAQGALAQNPQQEAPMQQAENPLPQQADQLTA